MVGLNTALRRACRRNITVSNRDLGLWRRPAQASRQEQGNGADLVRADAGIGLLEFPRNRHGRVKCRAFHEVEAKQLFFGLGIGTIGHQ